MTSHPSGLTIDTSNASSMGATPNTARDGQFAYAQPQAESSTAKRKLLSTYLTNHPSHTVSKAIRAEFPSPNPLFRLLRRFSVKHSVIKGLTAEEMAKYEVHGQELRRKAGWKLEGEEGPGAVVGELFWRMYLSLMPTLERDPLSGLVPPDLIGSTTTMPLSIISLIPDIMQHYRDVIIRAKKEIFLATNYWQPSNSVNTIAQSLRDLSAVIINENRPKVIVKVMYDRGSWEQLWNAHAPVKPSDWTPLDLPGKDEIPGLDMEVINFHKVLLGTFHAKFLIVDRQVALLNSNNIQDRPNLELMSHFEGPVVNSFYEVALHSWYNALSPTLPCLSERYRPPRDSQGRERYLFKDQNPYFDDIEILKAARAARERLRKEAKEVDDEQLASATEDHRFRDAVQRVMERRKEMADVWADWKPGEELNARAQNAMNELREFRGRWGLGGSRAGSRQGSRSNSRAPSRRASTDVVHRSGQYADKETAAITAQNALSTIDPSEAPSTPTIVGDYYPKSKTLPPPQHDGHYNEFDSAFNSPPGSPQANKLFLPDTGRESIKEKRKGHVLFLDTSDVDGTGRFFDNEGTVMSPTSTEKSVPNGHALDLQTNTTSPVTLAPPVPLDSSTAERKVVTGESPAMPNGVHAQTNGTFDTEIPQNGYHTGHSRPDTIHDDGDAHPRDGLVKIPVVRTATSGTAETDIPPEGTGSRRMFKMSKMFNAAGVLSEAWATVEDSDELDNFRPHVVHEPHAPFPIAMCCRKPHGFPGHHDIRNPQNAAWLAGFRYAKRKVFVQTPTLNARPIVRAVKQACRRGVNVTLLLDLGFNDKGESIPFQGGTNEEVVDRLYKVLRKDKKEGFLKVYWYTGKDQVRPLNAVKKQRNCHIKFAAYDDEVMIIGNGNQDSQSWFHSQEVNVMIDNKQVIAEMMETLLSNQNTMQYGLVDTDGVWRDKEGKTLGDYGATEKGTFRGLSGFIAFAKTI